MSIRELFSISTEWFDLSWSARLGPTDHESAWKPPGRLSVRPLKSGVPAPTVTRHVPATASCDEEAAATADLGPRLREETEYSIYLRPGGVTVGLRHEDPTVNGGLRTEADGTVHGSVNFRSNIGLTDFHITVDGQPYYVLTLKVFPTKLDYETDYPALVADVQDIATSLALEYLRSTYQLGRTAPRGTGDELQWVLLLKHIFDDLETGLRHVAARPRRSIVRDEALTSTHRVRRPDSSVRRSIRQRKGSGPMHDIGNGITARAKIWSRPARQTLDTPEHRWLAHQVELIRQRLARLTRTLQADQPDEQSARRRVELLQLRALESAAARLGRLEPLVAADGPPPSGFASQQLTSAPGYQEAYQACLILTAGLKLEGDALRLSAKELHRLYEYWCYLVIVRLLANLLDEPIQPAGLFKVRASGLRLNLVQGSESEVEFRGETHTVRVRYNPSFGSKSLVLVPQRPDVLITLEHEGWPALHLVLDAKYRLDEDAKYVRRYGGPGPPESALNVLHRYRDAILEQYGGEPARHIVQAAAMFPGRDTAAHTHDQSRQWASLRQLGVGSLPALPEGTAYLEGWLRDSLAQGGWQLADVTIPHAAHRRVEELRELEKERVWVVAADELTVQRAHVHRIHQLPLVHAEGAMRAEWLGFLVAEGQFAELTMQRITARRIADSAKAVDSTPPAVELALADERETKTLARDSEAEDVEGPTSRLAVQRATSTSQLLLDRLEDWRLRDSLHSRGILEAIEFRYDDLSDRPWLRTAAEGRARYEGKDGFAWEGNDGRRTQYARLDELLVGQFTSPPVTEAPPSVSDLSAEERRR